MSDVHDPLADPLTPEWRARVEDAARGIVWDNPVAKPRSAQPPSFRPPMLPRTINISLCLALGHRNVEIARHYGVTRQFVSLISHRERRRLDANQSLGTEEETI